MQGDVEQKSRDDLASIATQLSMENMKGKSTLAKTKHDHFYNREESLMYVFNGQPLHQLCEDYQDSFGIGQRQPIGWSVDFARLHIQEMGCTDSNPVQSGADPDVQSQVINQETLYQFLKMSFDERGDFDINELRSMVDGLVFFDGMEASALKQFLRFAMLKANSNFYDLQCSRRIPVFTICNAQGKFHARN
jgi:hypothetical protein